ncbi:MAG TPA: DNA polymerase III subunit epsilon [Alphaproteobacteria bacterium]|nr:DNA polymerase III subunit epsilon [Alphaproteobacteria bacterium]
MREIVLDTETTGLDPGSGHRIVEIGCVELLRRIPTGLTFQRYVNPEREIPAEARAVHGLTDAFLGAQPLFSGIAVDFLEFIGDAPLIIHNAEFDLGFVNAELARAGLAPLAASRAVDTVLLARRKFPGAPANLDALCRRFGIDNSSRQLHGALLDASLLAEVYLELTGGRQAGLGLAPAESTANLSGGLAARGAVRPPRPHQPSAEELAAHAALIARLKSPVWGS